MSPLTISSSRWARLQASTSIGLPGVVPICRRDSMPATVEW